MKEEWTKSTLHGFIGFDGQSSGFDISFSDSTFSAVEPCCNDTGIIGNLCPMGKFPGIFLRISVTTPFCYYELFFTCRITNEGK